MKTICTAQRAQGSPWVTLSFLLLLLAASLPVFAAAATRVIPAGQRPNDRRLEPLKDLDGYFPFTPATGAEQWAQRSERLRRQLLVTLGLWPMPVKCPLNAVIHGRIERDDYSVEKVYFESMPGFFVTGNLYRPKSGGARQSVVLCPHGHWTNGRFVDNPKIREDIASGEERFEEGGRSVLQARCVQLARMGCLVFHYDMIGYADSQQIPMSIAHSFARQRREMSTPENWGLYSPQAESQFQSVMGLQTYNSIRALDFMLSLPEADASRVGVTGASGGGTQTFILGAIDPRPTAAFPAVMVCTAMQGGCTCENASGLRVDTGNVEIAALFAPKPLGMTGANDWTVEMATKGMPELKRHFAMLGASENLTFKALNHFGHNYNSPSRSVMYSFMNKHLNLGLKEPVLERDYVRSSQEQLSVWDAAHAQPAGGAEFEKKLLRAWHDDAARQLQSAMGSASTWRDVAGRALEVVIGRSLPAAGEIAFDQKVKEDRGSYWALAGMLTESRRGEENPVLFFYPKEWKGRTVIWLHALGKSGLCDLSAAIPWTPTAGVKRLVEAGVVVVGMDLLYQGEFLGEREDFLETPRVKNSREATAYTLGYNPSVFASRVQDAMKLISFVKHHERASQSIELVGLSGAGHWATVARAMAEEWVTRSMIDTAGFRFGNVPTIRHPDLLPGGAKYGDIPGLLALGSTTRLWLAGETEESVRTAASFFAAAGKQNEFHLARSSPSAPIDWLLSP